MIRFLKRLRHSDDSGYVLAVVIGLGLVMLLMVATTLTMTTSGEQKSNTDTDWNAALAAAYAGVEDYKSRVENDSSYARFGNPSDPYTASSTGISLPTSTNPAFNITASQPWAVVPGSGGKAKFRYEIDNSNYGSTGVIRLRSTGKVGNQTRSVIADLKQNGFNDYVYYTNFEVQDPTISGESASCGNYYWIRPGSCAQIEFAPGDILRGKVHSNDRILVCGSDFEGAVTTASQTNPIYSIAGGCSDATFKHGIVKSQSIDMPPTNQTMPLETRNDLPAQVPHPGCMYTGPTSIKLNSNGTITVISPWTKYTNISATPGGSTNPAGCGKPGTSTGQLGSTGGATFATPTDNLVFVQNVPNDSSDPNYWSSSAKPSSFSCTTGTTNGRSKEGFKFGSFAYPTTNEDPPLTSTVSAPAYGCRNGDAYTSGTLKGHLTIASQNYIYIVGDLLYSNNQEDLLGLVAQNAVWVWDPMKNISTGGWYGASGNPLISKDRTIYAAILSVAHTFQVQNYQIGGARGTLKVVGSIAQNFRGTVGYGSNGFLKDYGYDTRLTYSSPPKFLMPTSTTYNTTQVAGVPRAFNADGSPSS